MVRGELLWNDGIEAEGKAGSETNCDVGDLAKTAIRRTEKELR